MKDKKKILALIMLIAWMVIVFILSGDIATESTEKSDYFVNATLNIFNFENTLKIVGLITYYVRKSAHLILYLIGGICIYNYLFRIENKYIKRNCYIFSIVFGAIYAISDELHQAFVPGRSCMIQDMCIDTVGCFLGVCIMYLFFKITTNKKRKAEK